MPITIDLNGPQGNAFFLLGQAKMWTRQLKDVDADRYNWDRIQSEMTSGDYDHLLRVFTEYFGEFVEFVTDFDLDEDYDEDEADAEWDEYWAECDNS